MMALGDRPDEHFERAQQQALEMLFQQCVDDIYAGDLMTLAPAGATNDTLGVSDRDTASFMDFLAQVCEDANEKLQDVSASDVAKKLAEAVAATQESLREVKASVGEILDDPEKMQTLTKQFDAAGERIKMLQQQEDARRRIGYGGEETMTLHASEQQLAVTSNEETLRNMMQFTDNMCGVLDNALSTITSDEYELAAQLSLGIAQKLLEAGQALFTSIGDESRANIAASSDRSDRITIEELPDDEDTKKKVSPATAARLRQKREQRKQAAAVRTYLLKLAESAQQRASDHPVAAAAVGAASLPFIGLAIPVASMVGLALVLEKYYPEHTSLTLELCSNFVQMAKLWFLLLKISARQLGSVAKQYLISWHEHALEHGYAATGKELVSTGCSLGWFCVSYLYKSLFKNTPLDDSEHGSME